MNHLKLIAEIEDRIEEARESFEFEAVSALESLLNWIRNESL